MCCVRGAALALPGDRNEAGLLPQDVALKSGFPSLYLLIKEEVLYRQVSHWRRRC